MEQLKTWLLGVHPAYLALASVAIVVALYLVRRFKPAWWAWLDSVTLPEHKVLSNVLQSVGIAGCAALVSVFLSGGDYQIAWLGAVAGAGAPVIHWIGKLLPFLPYDGASAFVKAAKAASSDEPEDPSDEDPPMTGLVSDAVH